MSVTHHFDKPIRSWPEDALERRPFINRLISALIDADSGLATGLTIGITGAWGSGKSSVLNLLTHTLQYHDQSTSLPTTVPSYLTINFDPWLISGRDDLILAFFREFINQLKIVRHHHPSIGLKIHQLAGQLVTYSASVTKVGTSLGLPYIDAAYSLTELLKRSFHFDSSLADLKRNISESLSNIGFPIIVLIDELDRVEDEEIHAIVQLVRAIADFPNVSYVLAYDADRVADALGRSDKSRGHNYLEKIVQLQIPLPHLTKDEIGNLFAADLVTQIGETESQYLLTNPRYDMLWQSLADETISTLRDQKRILGIFTVLRGMAGKEIDNLDLLAYSGLLAKFPNIAHKIRVNLEELVVDPVSNRATEIYWSRSAMSPDHELKTFLGEPSVDDANVEETPPGKLLKFLFPNVFGKSSAQPSHSDIVESGTMLRFRRSLMFAVTYGLPAGEFRHEDIATFLQISSHDMHDQITKLSEKGTLSAFLSRLDDVISVETECANERIWMSLAAAVEKDNMKWLNEPGILHNVSDTLRSTFSKWAVRQAANLQVGQNAIESMIGAGLLALPSRIIRSERFAHGLFGRTNRSDGIFDKNWVEKITNRHSEVCLDFHRKNELLRRLNDTAVLWNMADSGAWNDSERIRATREVTTSKEALIGFAMITFPPGYSVEKTAIAILIDNEMIKDMVDGVLQEEQITSVQRAVLERMRENL